MPRAAIHHVAYACRDCEQTRHFYEDLVGFPLLHTEVSRVPKGDGFFRHLFFDTGDGSALAFFEVHGIGERPEWTTAVSTGCGLPVWINHIAFAATEERQRSVRAAFTAAGIAPLMEIDHDWCYSLYYLDPNGIMIEFCRDTPGMTIDRTAALAGFTAAPAEHIKRPRDPN